MDGDASAVEEAPEDELPEYQAFGPMIAARMVWELTGEMSGIKFDTSGDSELPDAGIEAIGSLPSVKSSGEKPIEVAI